MSFQGKVVIVTGAGSGFGRGIAERFARDGAAVLVADVAEANGLTTAEGIKASGGRAAFLRCDVRIGEDFEALVQGALNLFGGIDVFVNNAGVSHPMEPMAQVSELEFERVMAINVKSLFWCGKHVAPHFIAKRKGCFVNIASISAKRPRPNIAWYVASKAAVVAATQAMAIELAPHGVRANAINPVAGDTPFLGAHGQVTSALREYFVGSIPLGRMAVPADIANAAAFLASDESSLITGAVLDVDGGRGV